jgi:hypothetical protein
MLITPPKLHISFDDSLRPGLPPTITVGDPAAQGPAGAGVQGMGVKTPRAAAVAAATAGFARLVHIAKGFTLTKGTLSIIDAAGFESTIAPLAGSTVNGDGAVPNEH